MYQPRHLKLWTMPDNYFGAVWPAYYSAGFGRSRESDCLEESNFATALAELGGEDADKTVVVVCESHWAVGWVEWIAIHQDNEVALKIADDLRDRLEDYPVLDDQDYSQREDDEAQQVWTNCYNDYERLDYIRKHRSQFEFADYADLIGCVRGKSFCGYANDLIGR
jgi:hypothetical protein